MSNPRLSLGLLTRDYAFPPFWLEHCLFISCLTHNVYSTALILTWMGNMPTFRRIGDTVKPLYHHMEPIELAFYNGHLNVVKLFLSIGGSLDHCTHLAPEIVHAAILGDDVVLLASLLAIPGMSGKIGYRYLSAESGLHLACQHGSLGCVTILCKRGANTEVYDVNSIRAADYLPQTNMLPVLVASSIRQCFSTDVSSVIFQQALKALGDLVDLENMRKSSVTLTAQRLGLDKDTFSHSDHKPSSISSMIKEWAKQTQEMCITIESLYTEVYSRCRNKAWGTTGSHDLLPPTILEALRSADFDDRVNIISAIKRKIGAVPEDPLLHWKSAERSIALKSLDQYLDTATSMIKDYSDLTGPNSLSYCGNDYPRNGKVYVVHWVCYHWFGQYARDLLEIMAPVILRTDNVLVCEIMLPRSGTVTELDDPGLQQLGPAALELHNNHALLLRFWSKLLKLDKIGLNLLSASKEGRRARLEIGTSAILQ